MNWKIFIPQEVQNQIHYLHNAVPGKEWCGGLIFEQALHEDSVEIHAIDIVPVQVGSEAYTEGELGVEMASKVMEYMMQGRKVFFGMVHSHHSMATNPSGTDNQMVMDALKTFNYFVSLIVNTTNRYTCLIGVNETTKTQGVEEVVFLGVDGEVRVRKNMDATVTGPKIHFAQVILPEAAQVEPAFADIVKRLIVEAANRAATKQYNYSAGFYNKGGGGVNTYPQQYQPKKPVQYSVPLQDNGASYLIDDIACALLQDQFKAIEDVVVLPTTRFQPHDYARAVSGIIRSKGHKEDLTEEIKTLRNNYRDDEVLQPLINAAGVNKATLRGRLAHHLSAILKASNDVTHVKR